VSVGPAADFRSDPQRGTSFGLRGGWIWDPDQAHVRRDRWSRGPLPLLQRLLSTSVHRPGRHR